MARPSKYDEKRVNEIIELLTAYIDTTPIPIIAEFAYLNDIPRHSLYDYEQFSTLIKKAIDKKESQLERMGLAKEVDTGMAIFSLKQLGWRDKQEADNGLTGQEIIALKELAGKEMRNNV